MLDPSASGEPSPPVDVPGRGDAGSRDNDAGSRGSGAWARALIVGVLVAMLAGIGIGIVIGNGARKRIDRWAHGY